jgi:hypothetical protein
MGEKRYQPCQFCLTQCLVEDRFRATRVTTDAAGVRGDWEKDCGAAGRLARQGRGQSSCSEVVPWGRVSVASQVGDRKQTRRASGTAKTNREATQKEARVLLAWTQSAARVRLWANVEWYCQ